MQYFIQNNFSGGLSDGPLTGLKGSLADGVGIDIHSTPGVIKVNQALKKDSGSTVTDFCKYAVNASDGNTYWFGNTGKIYQRTSLGVWSNVYTDANGEILGAFEFNGYMYWATATKLARKVFPGTNWTTDVNNAWKTLTTSSYHPMAVQSIYLFIGNANTIASVDDVGIFTASGTSSVAFSALPTRYTVKTLKNYDIDLLIGTEISSNYSSARVFRWDTVSPTYNVSDDIPETAVNCFLPVDNFMYVQAGQSGNIYYYDGAKNYKDKRIPGDYVGKTMIVHPGSTCNYLGRALFGVSNLSSNPCNEGVYSVARYNKNYPYALMQEYVNSHGSLTGVEVGAMIGAGTTLLVAWKNGATYGVDVIDAANKYASAYITTLQITGDRMMKKSYQNYAITYKSKPANTDISLSYSDNYNASFSSISLTEDETLYGKMRAQQNIEAGTMQYKISFTSSANTSPEIDQFYCDWDEQPTI